MADVENRYDFVYFFDVKDGNPNGDPDAGNLPRVDAETGNGLVTDVCLKRKVRNYVQLVKNNVAPNAILVRSKELSGVETIINKEIRIGYEKIGIDLHAPDGEGKPRKSDGKAQGKEVDMGRQFMCQNFFDVRTFGAVLSTGANAGQVRGPIQVTFARSIEPVLSAEHSITVSAARMEEKTYEEQVGIQGRKFTIPYGLYRAYGFISAPLAKQTGFSAEDLELFWEALQNMFEHDRSAARGLMSARRLVIFKHSSLMGDRPVQGLFDRVTVKRKDDASIAARDFSQYAVSLDGNELTEFKTSVPAT
jgi:CRISPR-associated protein Csd2